MSRSPWSTKNTVKTESWLFHQLIIHRPPSYLEDPVSNSPAFLLESLRLSHFCEERRWCNVTIFAYHKNVKCVFLKTTMGIYVHTCAHVCNSLASLKSGLGWAPASFSCLLPFTHVLAEICQSPSLMGPRVVLRAIELRQPFSMGLIIGSPFSCSSVKVFVLVFLAPILWKLLWKAFNTVLSTGPPNLALHQPKFCPWIKGVVSFQIGH